MTFVIIAVTSMCRDITCESVPGSPLPFLFFVGARGEPGNEARITVHKRRFFLKEQLGAVYITL